MPVGVRFVQFDIRSLDRQIASFRHRITGIDDQVQDDLFDLPRIRFDEAQSRLQDSLQMDVLADQGLEHGLKVRYHGIQVQHFQVLNLPAAEGQQLACQGCGPPSRFLDMLDVFASKEIGSEAVDHKFTVAPLVFTHATVIDATGKPADRLHLLSLAKLLFQSGSVLVGQLAFPPFLNLAQGTTHGMGQSCEVVFQHVVCGAGFQRCDRCVFSDGAGHKNEGDVRTQFSHMSQRRQSLV